MKNKKIWFTVIFLLVLIGILLILRCNYKQDYDLILNVNIIQYGDNGQSQEQKIKIDSNEDLKKCREFYKKLKPLSADELVELALLEDVVIEFNENTKVIIQIDQPYYCYYINKDKNISALSKMPSGLYNWVMDKLN